MSEKENTAAMQQDDILLEVRDLKKYFPIKGGLFNKVVGQVRAVDGISFKLKRGTTMGLVGESGCGKSTAGRTILRLLERTSGEILFNGTDIGTLTKKQLRAIRPKIQIIFQDPYSSLSPGSRLARSSARRSGNTGLSPKRTTTIIWTRS